MYSLALRFASAVSSAVLEISSAQAAPAYTVSFDDPANAHAAYYSEVTASVLAAGSAWANALDNNGNITIGIEVGFSPAILTEEGASTTSHLFGYDLSSNVPVYEQGAAAKLRGAVPDAPSIDGRITIGNDFLSSLSFFDGPAASAATDLIPSGKVDAYSVFLHEFGHILAFNGWRDGQTGMLSTPYESTFDKWVVQMDGNLFFNGPHAEAIYGGPVPLTWGDYGHVGNKAGRPGQDLISDLMNGVSWVPGLHYNISPLDLAIVVDAGLPVVGQATEIAEPSSLILLAVGYLVALSSRRQWSKAG